MILAAIIVICWRGIDEFVIFAFLIIGAIRYDISTRLVVIVIGYYLVVVASFWRVVGGDCYCDFGIRSFGDGGKRFFRFD